MPTVEAPGRSDRLHRPIYKPAVAALLDIRVAYGRPTELLHARLMTRATEWVIEVLWEDAGKH